MFSYISFPKFLCILISLVYHLNHISGQVQGIVVNNKRQGIESVQIINITKNIGVLTDANGKFSIEASPDDLLKLTHINYEAFRFQVSISKGDTIILQYRNYSIDEINITSSPDPDVYLSNTKSINRVPSFLGEKDVKKYLATLPGVTSTSLLDAGIYVRGGNSSQNAYLVNNISIADPQHLTGILSTFDPYILDHSKFYKSGFPSNYNGYLSSYIDMSTFNYFNQPFTSEISLGLLSSSLKAKYKFNKDDRKTIGISYRKSYFEYMADAYNTISTQSLPRYSFSDYNLSLRYPINKKWSSSFLAILTDDKLPMKNEKLYWSSLSTVASLLGQINEKTILNVSFGYSNYKSSISRTFQESFNNTTNTNQTNFLLSINNKPSKRLSISTGLNSGLKRFGYLQQSATSVQNSYNYLLTSLFIESTFDLSPEFSIISGANLFGFYEKYYYTGLSPRVKIIFKRPYFSWWSDYSRTLQFEERMPIFNIMSPVDLNIPIHDGLSPSQSDQISTGTTFQYKNFPTIVLGLYYKHLSEIKDFVSDDRSGYSFLSNKMVTGYGHVYGFEFDGTYNTSLLYLRANYTLSEVSQYFSEINDGNELHPPYDVRHNILINSSLKISPKLSVNLLWSFMSGTTTTLPIGVAVIKDITAQKNLLKYIPVYEDRYNYNLPATHRLDLRFDYDKRINSNMLKFSIGVYNLYNQQNVSFAYIEPEAKDDYFVRFKLKSKVLLPFLPYFSVKYIINV